ncbi:MAG: TerC/Alx family metal homeostasis membrane protein [Bacteroidales bacterium]|nr:TerC/Alx family metal homeostasis membrane protein [Bacteroidales bacterium]
MSRIIFFVGFMMFIFAMLALDLGVFNKRDHVIGVKESARNTIMWVLLSMGMAALIYFHAEWVHGIHNMEDLLALANGTSWGALLNGVTDYDQALKIYRKEMATQYLAGYFLEESLSIDNIFVIILIFTSFGIPKEYYHRVLFWGILGAIVMRFIFIFGIGALVHRFSWLLAVFGAFLVFSGVRMFKKKEENIDTANHPVVKFCTKYFSATPKIDGHKFFSRIDGRSYMTPLFITLLVIEFTDVIFAVDSIPAVFAVTTDTYIVFFSNIFAVMGLRSLFFLLSDISDKFWLLQYGLGVLLTFIGLKMVLHEFTSFDITAVQSLLTIVAILAASIVLSIVVRKPAKKVEKDVPST